MGVGQALVRIRQEKSLTQGQVAERSGLTTSYISRIENERVHPTLATLEKVAAALGVAMSTVFDWNERGRALLQHRCAVSSSGTCIGQQVRSGRGRTPVHKRGGYGPAELDLLRMTDRIALQGSKDMRQALKLLLESLVQQLEARGSGA